MKFAKFSDYLDKIDKTSSRLEITEIISLMLEEATVEEIDKLVYLSLGNLGPPFDRVEFNMSDKMVIKALARESGQTYVEVTQKCKEFGDVGSYIFSWKKNGTDSSYSVEQIFSILLDIAQDQGSGSQGRKVNALARLISELSPNEAKYLVRIPVGKLRLGFSDMTILDALSWMKAGDKSLRKNLERAYNVSADIGIIAQLVKREGIDALRSVKITPGIPIRPAAADRLPTADAIIEKLGEVAAEPKIDGFRLQCHMKRGGLPTRFKRSKDKSLLDDECEIRFYSRNLEDMTGMFPELVTAVKALNVDEIIFEGEAVAYNTGTDDFLPFQETMQRRRKHNINAKAQEIPLKLFAFDLLYLNGRSYLDEPYTVRRERLNEVVSGKSCDLSVTPEKRFSDGAALSNYFNEQIEHGLEGLMTKRLDAPYAAGARNSNWVKLKREEKGELTDTIDCLVLGYKKGEGKRTSFGIGAFLVGVYDEDEDIFRTVSNVGTGLTDEQWREMKRRADALLADKIPSQYDVPKELTQDVWIKPGMVVEVLADEITRSPIHSAKYALRFPRLVRWRDDKDPQQATSIKELLVLFDSQKNR